MSVKFNIPLDESEEREEQHQAPAAYDLIADVQERQPTAPKPPAFPALTSKTGFPSHTKRKIAFKGRPRPHEGRSDAGGKPAATAVSPQSIDRSSVPDERQQIHQENEHRLAAMSDDEIAEARKEIMGALDPALLQRLLARSDIGSGSNEATSIDDLPATTHISRQPLTAGTTIQLDDDHMQDDDPASAEEHKPEVTDTIHFPRPPQPPDLDPSSATFLDDLHSKYFPSLPADVDKLEWMRTSTNTNNSYDPAQSALKPGDIRFDFKGALIPPSRALAIPVSAGLHHHGDAPDAAGYTIPELAHLSRSTYAPQRCIAFQTLGRVLYKLGRGEFGDPGEPGEDTVGAEETMGELARGLWREVEAQHVIQQLVAESEGNGVDGGRHVSAKAYATEAVWLWQKGGGRRWKTS